MRARRPPAAFAVVSWLLISAAFAAPAGGQTYRRETRQEHFGPRCTHDDTQVAGGTIVGGGGQVIAGGGGTGLGCDTFYAYEVRASEPKAGAPWTEPAVYLNPGRAARL